MLLWFQSGKVILKSRTMKALILFLFLPIFLWGINFKFTNLTQEQIPIQKSSITKSYYKLTAKKHIKKFSKKSQALLFFNRKKFMLENNYYADGLFYTEESHFSYKKAYILAGKVHLFEVQGYINKHHIKAKEVIYDGYKTYHLKKCEIKINSKILRRSDYQLTEHSLQ